MQRNEQEKSAFKREFVHCLQTEQQQSGAQCSFTRSNPCLSME